MTTLSELLEIANKISIEANDNLINSERAFNEAKEKYLFAETYRMKIFEQYINSLKK